MPSSRLTGRDILKDMADPFSLVGRMPPPPSSGSPSPVAKPSFFDQLMGRGKYMQEFTSRRRDLVEQARREKQRLYRDMRKQKREIVLKVRRDDKKTYQQFDIKQSLRANKPGLSESEQAKAREKTRLKINKELREQRRAAERTIERQRDEEIRTMRDQLHDGVYKPAA